MEPSDSATALPPSAISSSSTTTSSSASASGSASSTVFTSGPLGDAPGSAKGLRKDVASMMFGFGDSWPPNEGSTALMEKLVENYITDLTMRACIVANSTGKLDKECFQYLVRKDRTKFNRIFRLLKSKEEIDKETEKDLKDELATV